MKLLNPIYLSFSLVLAAYVALANHNGWSLVHSVTHRLPMVFSPSTQHK